MKGTHSQVKKTKETQFIKDFKADMNNKLDIYLNNILKDYETNRTKT